MTVAGFSWTLLRSSRERRVWLSIAGLVCATLAVILAARALSGPVVSSAWPLLLGAAAAAIGSGSAARAVLVDPPSVGLSVDSDGAIWGRIGMPAAADESVPPIEFQPRIVSDRLVTLCSGGLWVAVWRDALPPEYFRRLCAHARWRVERMPRGSRPDHAAPDGTN
jgi:hypothetical protein